MKKTLYLLLFIPLSFSAFAQTENDSDEINTLFNEDVSFGGFGGYMLDYSTVGGELLFMNGGGGGVLLNRKFFLGGFGLSSANTVDIDFGEYNRMNFGYGGLWLGYLFFPEKAVHLGIDSKFGWGGVTYRESGIFGSRNTDGIYVVNPSAFVAMNVTKWFKIQAGGGYRLVQGANDRYFNNEQLSGINMNLSFQFGWFN